jgi:energy coupling factor transporter S component ThiW
MPKIKHSETKGALQENSLSKPRTFAARLCVMALIIAASVALQLYLRVPGFSPMQHFFNVICAVLFGPWYSLVCAVLTAGIRMALFGVTPLALTGSVFGAVLSGLLYRHSKRVPVFGRYVLAAIGEVIGTGVIGAIISYPVMVLFLGNTDGTLLGYVPAWLLSTAMGAALGLMLLFALKRRNLIGRLQRQFGNKDAER